MSQREYCSLCGRGMAPFDVYYTEDGPVHMSCQSLTSGPADVRVRGRDGREPDYRAPSLAQQEYVRKASHWYATLFHAPVKSRAVRPRRGQRYG